MMKTLLSTCLLSSALFVGCAGSSEEVDGEGCEHLRQGPAVAVSASGSASGAPAVSNDHKRYDLTLPSGAGGSTGSVSFASSEATDYVFFLSADVPLKISSSSGEAVALESSATSSSACGDIKGRHVAPLKVGTYTLTFGPAPSERVSLVIEESGAGHEH